MTLAGDRRRRNAPVPAEGSNGTSGHSAARKVSGRRGAMIDQMLTPARDPRLRSEIRAAMLSTPDHVAISAMSGMADENAYEPGPMKVPVLAVPAKSHPWPTDIEQFL